MYTDKFELLNADGNVIATKTILNHMKIVLVERGGVKPGETFFVRSVVNSRQVLKITEKTPAEAWHDFERLFGDVYSANGNLIHWERNDICYS